MERSVPGAGEVIPSGRRADAQAPSRERIAAVGALYLLVVISIVPWRSQTFYTGGADPVVLAKAAIASLALIGAVLLTLHTRGRVAVGLGPGGVLAAAVLLSLLGAVVAGEAPATVVLVVRVLMLMATLLLILGCVPWDVALACLFSAMAIVAVVAAATGLGEYAATGRLGGGTPQIHPNELAALAATPLVGMWIVSLRRGSRLWHFLVIGLLFAIVLASGSRTALIGVVVGIVLAVVFNGVHDRVILYLMLLSTPVLYTLAVFTGVLGSLASRDGSSATGSSLDSRFVAWNVVLGWDWTSWKRWIGLGLSVEQVPVNNKWRPEQVLDSSWVSLLAQGGLLAVILVASLVAWCIVTVLVSRRRRSVLLPLLALLLIRSGTESGLVDAAMPFVLLVTYSALLTHRSRHAMDRFGDVDGRGRLVGSASTLPLPRALGRSL